MTRFTLVPLLKHQRDLLALPRNASRFQTYLNIMLAGRREPVLTPLVAFNPMARGHVADRLDTLLSFDAERVAAEALVEAESRLGDFPLSDPLSVGLVVVDDLHGGWTNRHATEIALCFEPGYVLNHGWLTVAVWSSEESSRDSVRRETLATAYRARTILTDGPPRTLRERLDFHGRACFFAGETSPTLDPDDLAYTRQVIAPFLDATDLPTHIACLFGDTAAKALGMPALGLSPRAGLALAVAEATAAVSQPD